MGFEEFRKYCSENQCYGPEEQRAGELQKLIDKVCASPDIVRVRGVSEVYKEVTIGRGKSASIVHAVLIDGEREIYLVECNVSSTGRKRERSGVLGRAYTHVLRTFEISPQLLVVRNYGGRSPEAVKQAPPIESILQAIQQG